MWIFQGKKSQIYESRKQRKFNVSFYSVLRMEGEELHPILRLLRLYRKQVDCMRVYTDSVTVRNCTQRPQEFRRCSCRKTAWRPNSVHGADQGWSLLEEEVLLEEELLLGEEVPLGEELLLEEELPLEEEVLLEEEAEDGGGGTGTGEMGKKGDKEEVQTD